MLPASKHNEGQGLVEYALIIAFVVLVVIILLFLFGTELGNLYSFIIQEI
ncbi:MAG: pilus assembly protein [Anaerolineaceae bacterium]|jgi:Flp pilus assembly pilin Flp